MDVLEPHLQKLMLHDNVREQFMFLLMMVILFYFFYVMIFKYESLIVGIPNMDEDELNVYYNTIWFCGVAFIVAWLAGVIMP